MSSLPDRRLSAGEAWKIVQLGQRWLSDKLNDEHREARHEKWRRDYARACAIVAGCVEEHSALDHLSDYEVPLSVLKVRQLERGQEGEA